MHGLAIVVVWVGFVGAAFLVFFFMGLCVVCCVLCFPATEIPGEESLDEESGQCLDKKQLTADGCALRSAFRPVAFISPKSRFLGDDGEDVPCSSENG